MSNVVEQTGYIGRAASTTHERIPHSKPTIDETDIRAVTDALAAGRLADSTQVALFEEELSAYLGSGGGVATNSGTSALCLALLSLDPDGRSEVIIPSYACIALLNAIYAAHLTPVVVDIDEGGYNISLNAVVKALTRRTKAIIAPHMFGDPIPDIEAIVDLGVPVIEDCALSLGARVGGRMVGSLGELTVCSFYATKLLTTGHGGMVLSGSDQRLNRLRDLVQYDQRPEYAQSFNFSLTDFQAALGRSQLTKLDSFIARRQSIAREYDRSLEAMSHIRVPVRAQGSIYFRYLLEVPGADAWINRINSRGVDCRRPVFKPLHEYLNLNRADYPNADRAQRRSVSVPIYPGLREHEMESVIDRIAAC